jgi:hypothetical protein
MGVDEIARRLLMYCFLKFGEGKPLGNLGSGGQEDVYRKVNEVQNDWKRAPSCGWSP